MTGGVAETPQAPPDSHKVAAIVVTHNRLDHLKISLRQLLNSDPDHLSAVVVYDNASTDGTKDWLNQQSDPRLSVISGPRNIGGAGGFEQAMRWAADFLDPDWMLLLDDDARPMPGCVRRFAEQPRQDCQAWAAAVFTPDGNICEMNRPTRNPFWSMRLFFNTLLRGTSAFHLADAEYQGPGPTPIDVASFVGLFVSRTAISRVGFPDGRLFLYGDDVLYCLSLRHAGLRIFFDPALKFEHDCQPSHSVVPAPLWKPYYARRNLLLAYRKAAGFWFLPVLCIKVIGWFFTLRAYPKSMRKNQKRLLFKAICDGVSGNLSRHHDEITCMAGGQ